MEAILRLIGIQCKYENITYNEILTKINNENKIIIIVDKNVYDVTNYMNSGNHRGGTEWVAKKNGKDCTKDLKVFHSSSANKYLKYYYIGKYTDDMDLIKIAG